MAQAKDYLKGSKKILKYAKSIEKAKIMLPLGEKYYQLFVIPTMSQSQAQKSMPSGQKMNGTDQISNLVDIGHRSAVVDTGHQAGLSKSAAAIEDESKVLRAATDIKSQVTEGIMIIGTSDTYEEFHAEIIRGFDETYRINGKIFKSVLDNPASYSQELVKHVKGVVKAVQNMGKNFDSFCRGETEFEKFKDLLLQAADQMNKQETPNKPLTNTGVTQEHARVPKKDEYPVSNIDMTSMMSNEVNKRAARQDEQGDEDNIDLPEHMEPEVSPLPTPSHQLQKIRQDQEEMGQFMQADFDDDENDNQGYEQQGNEFTMGFGDGDEDGWGRVTKFENAIETVPELSNSRASERLSKVNQDTNLQDNSPGGFSRSISRTSKTSKSNFQTRPKIKVLSPDHQLPDNNGDNQWATPKEEPRQEFYTPKDMDEAGYFKEEVVPQVSKPVKMTEEEKVKLAMKNQKTLGDPTTQAALTDFFTKSLEQKQGGFLGGGSTDIFAKARAKAKGKPAEPEHTKEIDQFSSKSSQNRAKSTEINKPSEKPTDFFGADAGNVFDAAKIDPHKRTSQVGDTQGGVDDEIRQIMRSSRRKTIEQMEEKFNPDGSPKHLDLREPDFGDNHNHDQDQPPQDNYNDGQGHDANYYQAEVGGLMEDANNDYYAPPDLEKMKQDIIRMEEERKRKEQETASHVRSSIGSENVKSSAKIQKTGRVTEDEIKNKAKEDNFEQDYFENVEFGAEGLSRDHQDNFYDNFFENPVHHQRDNLQNPQSTQGEYYHDSEEQRHQPSRQSVGRHPASPKPAQRRPQLPDEYAPGDRHHQAQDAGLDVRPKIAESDFFTSPGQHGRLAAMPTEQRASLAVPAAHRIGKGSGFSINNHIQPINEEKRKSINDSEMFFAADQSEIAVTEMISKSVLDNLGGNQTISSQKLADILSENHRLRQENGYMQKTTRTLEDSVTGLTKQMRTEVEKKLNLDKTLEEKVKNYEAAYEREKREREMFEEKYRDLYTKWRQEKEVEVLNGSIFDPKKILELSQVNNQLKTEKRHLANRLSEETEKTRYMESIKEELNRTRKELLEVTRQYNSYVADMSKTNLNPEESILRDIDNHKPSTINPNASIPLQNSLFSQHEQNNIRQQRTPLTENNHIPSHLNPQSTGRDQLDNQTPSAPLIGPSPMHRATLKSLAQNDNIMVDKGSKLVSDDKGIENEEYLNVFDRADLEEQKEKNKSQNLFHYEMSAEKQNSPQTHKDRVDVSKYSPEFSTYTTKKGTPNPGNANGFVSQNHGIGLRSSHHSYMSQVDKLESDLLDQSDLDFLANFQRELNDTCKQIVIPEDKLPPRHHFSTSLFSNRASPDRLSHQPVQPVHTKQVPTSMRHSAVSQVNAYIQDIPTSPRYQAPQYNHGMAAINLPAQHNAVNVSDRTTKGQVLAPYTSIFGGDIPLPRRSHQVGMRDSHYSKDSVSGATVYSTMTRPSFRY